MNSRLSKSIVVLIVAVTLLVGLNLSLAVVIAAQAETGLDGIPAVPPSAPQNSPPENFPIISDTVSQAWPGISGDCIAYRDVNGGVYLHNLTRSETFTITQEPDEVRKVVVSQGVVVWRSDRQGANGLWGYYNPSCSDAGLFGSEIITPFHIVSRANAHAPALSGEMVTFDTWAPAGAWYVALVELDANNNGILDATEDGYDPTDSSIIIRLSCCGWGPNGYFWQRLSDVYWDSDYKLACWVVTSTFPQPNTLTCNDLHHYQEPQPWIYQFQVNSDTNIAPYDFGGIIAIHRDLVVWTGSREGNLSGYDLYIADLDPDDDGILNTEDPEEFVLVNFPWGQEYPDIWWPFVVWADRRNGSQYAVYAYDLSLDSDGDDIPNWRDPNRTCMDQAEFSVVFHPATQTAPEIWNDTVVWVDWRNGNGDIYGAYLQPIQPQPRLPISGTAQEKAIYWLDKQTVHFSQVGDIPGYDPGTGMVERYKSSTRDEVERVLLTWYNAIPGTYLVSFDFCYYGTPDQKRYLGRFGRGFTYDQALTLIARTMLAQPTEAEELGRYVSSFQNSGQLTTTVPGSFGFSFNGQGFWSEKDNFYDMDYLRGGANGWIGYGYLYYSRQYDNDDDVQFMDVMTGVADYILSLQALDPMTDAYGLFKGGYGRWSHKDPNEFIDEDIEWVSAEHNIDIYFFLRDLGELTGDSRYSEAANLQKANMIKLWNEEKGRFDQGLGDPFDALDAASWGAMYWIAGGDLAKAKRSLEYADKTYSNTVTVSNTITISPEITVSGYKPYTGSDGVIDWTDLDLVWSEGSLGVAMANLKLGRALLNYCDDPRGNTFIQKAEAIVAEMEKLQTLDPEGGLFYSVYPDYPGFPGGVITDFARAPSAAGTMWFLMVQKAMEDEALREAFWGRDQEFSTDVICPIGDVDIFGPTMGVINIPYTFTATVHPITTTLPITYIWQATGQDGPITRTNDLNDSVPFSWTMTGVQAITVTAINTDSLISDTHTISISRPPDNVAIEGPTTGIVGTSYTFTATVSPSTASLPITYTWSPAPNSGQDTPVAIYTWTTPGPKTITVTATNPGGMVTDTHAIIITDPFPWKIYLPTVLKN